MERLVDRPDGMPKLHSGVPNRIPDALGDLGRRPFKLVDQQQVEIRTGTQITTAVTTHRRQRETWNIADIVDDRPEPGIDLCGVAAASAVPTRERSATTPAAAGIVFIERRGHVAS